MTETPARIRWTDSRNSPGDPAFTGSVGTVDPSVFQIHSPDGFAPQWTLTTSLTGMEDKRSFADGPDELKAEAERWLEEFISSLGAVFPGDPDGNAIDAATARFADDGDERHLIQYAVKLPDGRTQAYGDQSWVQYGQAAKEHDEGSSTAVRDIWVSYGPWRTHQTIAAPAAEKE